MAKVRRLRALIDNSGSTALIQVDGGINASTAPLVAAAGADSVVAGSAVFAAPDPKAVIAELAAIGSRK